LFNVDIGPVSFSLFLKAGILCNVSAQKLIGVSSKGSVLLQKEKYTKLSFLAYVFVSGTNLNTNL